ncbi:PREDICTED: cyclin-dependent kinase inhibitor 4-like isoform X2 [Camelina sativa]|uniref:Cyclin-dependent kinase inhibitor 4-like isoform X2 n=1 Tax=Camelina sativa TaxID=90675 RepID=A0ABM1RQQ6_CAMSA|nr:PREDICTED: cyclin-dependent kinase inhibitor 4-like isoform X2 [Camelina sativa]
MGLGLIQFLKVLSLGKIKNWFVKSTKILPLGKLLNKGMLGFSVFLRTTRESTPCSLIGKPEIITTPGSSTKLNICISESNQREESLSRSSLRHLPTTPEMDEFFSGAEEEQQKQFIEKYNFDPVNEQPLPGRFEWTKVDD